MSYEHSIARYRNLYAKLLRFYPKPYRERFGEGMEQTFNDLVRERKEVEDGLFGFVLWVFVETSAGIIRENITFIIMQNKSIIRVAIVVGLILLIPLFGNIFIDGWNWGIGAFVFFGAVLFGAGLVYELRGKNNKVGVVGGFVFGVLAGLLAIVVLHRLYPEEDPAGIVIITLLISGLFFAFVGYIIQNYLKKR